MNELIKCNSHPSVWFVIKVFDLNGNLRNMLTEFINVRIHTTVEFVTKVFHISVTKICMFEKFMRLGQPQKV